MRIGSITCGAVMCKLGLRVSGRDPSGGILINVVRKKTKHRKAVDRFVLARKDANGVWYARADLPYGRLIIYAFPYKGDLEDLDGAATPPSSPSPRLSRPARGRPAASGAWANRPAHARDWRPRGGETGGRAGGPR